METAVLYFGGDYISLVIAKPGVNKTYIEKSHEKIAYSGIVNGEFVNNEELPLAFNKLIMDSKISRGTTLTVGVPSTFCDVHVSTEVKNFVKPQKISKRDVDELIGGGSAIYFKIDGGDPLIDAVGVDVTRTLEARVSHTEILPVFTDIINIFGIFAKAFSHVKLVPIILTEARYLVEPFVRDRTCVVISSKMFTTSVGVVAGDELCALTTVNMGTVHLINDISVILSLDFTKARERFLNYSGESDPIHAIVKARLDDMAEQIFAAVNNIDRNLYSRPFFVTGGHIDTVSGARGVFEKLLNVKITQLTCPLSESNIPDKASIDGLVLASF
jgi:hypothetical protein